MNRSTRVLALVLVVPATFYFVLWVPLSLVSFGSLGWLRAVIALACALVVGSCIWRFRDDGRKGPVAPILAGAVLLGSIGFIAGFVGPMVLAPEANQGPLLGLLVTGPLGFLLGGIAGFVFWVLRHRRDEGTPGRPVSGADGP